jgi:hypothetical protein
VDPTPHVERRRARHRTAAAVVAACASSPDARLQPEGRAVLVAGGGGGRADPGAPGASTAGAAGGRPLGGAGGRGAGVAGRAVPDPHPALEEFLHRGRDLHLPAAADARPGGGDAGSGRRGAAGVVAHLQALDQPPGQPGDGEPGHVRRRVGLDGGPAGPEGARARQCRRGPAGHDGQCARLLRAQHRAVYGIGLPQAQQLARARGTGRPVRLGRHHLCRQRRDRQPAVPELQAVGHHRAAGGRARHRAAARDPALLLPPARGGRGGTPEPAGRGRTRGPARRRPRDRAAGERAALSQRLLARLDRHGPGGVRRPRAAGQRRAVRAAGLRGGNRAHAAFDDRLRRRRRRRDPAQADAGPAGGPLLVVRRRVRLAAPRWRRALGGRARQPLRRGRVRYQAPDPAGAGHHGQAQGRGRAAAHRLSTTA